MVFKYELIVKSVDFLGKKRDWEFIVVAKDDVERNEVLASVMDLHDEVESWSIKETRDHSELDLESPFLADYGTRSVPTTLKVRIDSQPRSEESRGRSRRERAAREPNL